nr:peptidylprolyl isomerase [uncultured Mailhella sp.]
MRKLLIFCLIVTATFILGTTGQAQAGGKTMVTLQTTKGDIVLELDAEKAPKTTKNFLQYVKDGFYNGTIFHRVIPGFMIQGGGFTRDMVQKPTREPIDNEADNGLKNDVYTIAMARTQAPHSATAQFFINVANNSFLNYSAPTMQGWGYAVFGKVVKGQNVVDAIAGVPTTSHYPHQDVPVEPVIIKKAVID